MSVFEGCRARGRVRPTELACRFERFRIYGKIACAVYAFVGRDIRIGGMLDAVSRTQRLDERMKMKTSRL
jgi:hypothetical protein